MKNVLCLIGLHKWKNFRSTEKDMYIKSFLVTEYFKCLRCKAKKKEQYKRGNWKCGSEVEDGSNYKNYNHC